MAFDIETLDDLTLASSCCCGPVGCPVPLSEGEIALGRVTLHFSVSLYINPSLTEYYRERRTDYSDGGFFSFESTGDFEATLLPSPVIVDEDIVYTEGFPQTGTPTQSKVGLIDVEAAMSSGLAALAAVDPWSEAGVTIEPGYQSELTQSATSRLAQFFRITYRVPHEWTDPISGSTVPFPGTYFKLTYDILTTPYGWNDAPEYTGPGRSYLADQTMVWSGPGSGDADDPSWVIGTVEIDPPGEAGTRKIVNLRFTCRDEGMFANVPQVTGTAADLSEDIPLTRTFDRPTGSIHLPL